MNRKTNASVLPLLLRRKWAIILWGLGGSVASLVLAQVIPFRYASEGSLVIENREPNIPELGIGSNASASPIADPTKTQMDVISSRGLIAKVVRDQHLNLEDGLQPVLLFPESIENIVKQIQALVRRAASSDASSTADPVEDATEYVQRHLQVKVSDESHVLSLQFQAAKADKASVVVNGIMAEYISADTAARRAQALEVSQWFTSRADVALQELRAARLRIQNYAQAHNSPQVQGSSVAALQLSKDQADLAVARQTVARQQAALETIKRMGVRGDSTQAGAETLGSPTIQALQKLEAQTQLKLAPFGPNDPRRAQLEHGLNSIHQRISDETKRIIASLERERDITHAHVVELEKAVQGATDKARDASVAELSLAALTSDAEAAKQRYENLLGRAEATKLASAQLPSARIISYAVPAHRPVFSRGVLDAISVLMGFIVGTSLATSVLLLKNILGTKITSRLDLATTTDLSVVGCLPETKSMIALGQSPVHVTETLRAVWLAIRSRASKDGGSTIVVTSSEAGEGKTTVAATLARRVASDGFRALLVDGDMRRPQLSAALKLRIIHSLESVLGGVVDFESAVIRDEKSGLDFLPAAGNSSNPIKLLASPEFAVLMSRFRRSYDFVIIDSPPVLRVADALIMAESAELVLFVVGSGLVSSGSVSEAIRRFSERDRRKIMTLLTRIRSWRPDVSDYYSGYEPSASRARLEYAEDA